MKINKIISSLGLCSKAGKLVCGVPMVCEALGAKKAKPFLVLEAADTSENTHKRITDKCNFYSVKKIRLGLPGETIAQAIGKTGIIGAVAVTDPGLASLIEKVVGDDGVDTLNK